MGEPSDDEIIRIFRKDKDRGFRLLYNKYAESLFPLCYRYSADHDKVMDLFQEAMIRIYDKLWSFKGGKEGTLFRWMKRITENLIADKYRRKHTIIIQEIDINTIHIEEPSAEIIDSIPLEVLYKMIDLLSPAKKMVFYLFYVEGHSYKEIADLLGMTENGVSSTISKARKVLIKRINEYKNNNQL